MGKRGGGIKGARYCKSYIQSKSGDAAVDLSVEREGSEGGEQLTQLRVPPQLKTLSRQDEK